MRRIAIALLCSLCIFGANCSRILVLPWQIKSHMLGVNAIAQELKANGHEVYTIAEDTFKGKENRIGAAGLDVLYNSIPEGTATFESEMMQKEVIRWILSGTTNVSLTGPMAIEGCKNMVEDKALIQKITDLNFDLAVVEAIPFIPCLHLVPHILNIPHVSILGSFVPSMLAGYAGLPSFSPPILISPQTLPMSFKERLISIIFYMATSRQGLPYLAPLFMPEINDFSMIEKYRSQGLVSDHIQSWADFPDETQLTILLNADITFDFPKPLYPNVISVDGITVKEAKPLPKDIEDLVETSSNGVVVVSFGSNVKYLPEEMVIKLVNTFKRRKELFIIRYSGSLTKKNYNLPSNVKFMAWLPQTDLLAHKKTKLFITHGGKNGLHEAIYQGVPMLCAPLFGDQSENAVKLEHKGLGLTFKITDYTEDELLEKIETLISDPVFGKNAQLASKKMRHQPMNARQTAAFWIEHVLQFGGEHLKPSSVYLTWWQYFCLDTLGFIILAVTIILLTISLLLKYIFRLIVKTLETTKHQKRE